MMYEKGNLSVFTQELSREAENVDLGKNVRISQNQERKAYGFETLKNPENRILMRFSGQKIWSE